MKEFIPFLDITINPDLFHILRKWNLSGRQFNVFFAALTYLDDDNFVKASQLEISKELNVHQASISAGFCELKKMNFVFELKIQGRFNAYCVSPHLVWKGTEINHKKALKKYAKIKYIEKRGE